MSDEQTPSQAPDGPNEEQPPEILPDDVSEGGEPTSPFPKKMPGKPFQKGQDPRRYVSKPNYHPPVAPPTERVKFKQLQDITREELGKRIISFGSKTKAELIQISKDENATAIDQFVAALWFSGGQTKGSPTDKKLLFITHGLPIDSKHIDLSSGDGSMSPQAAQPGSVVAIAGASFLSLGDLDDDTLLKLRENAERLNSQQRKPHVLRPSEAPDEEPEAEPETDVPDGLVEATAEPTSQNSDSIEDPKPEAPNVEHPAG